MTRPKIFTATTFAPASALAAVVLTAAVFLAGPCAAASQKPAANFRDGVDRYQKGDYAESAREFARLADGGLESPAVYFNMGNAYLKAGQIGRAAWAYERAFMLDPRDEDIRFNRSVVKAALGEPVAAGSQGDVLDPVRRFLDYVRTAEIELALQFSTILLVVLMLAFAYARNLRPIIGTFFWLAFMASTLVWGAAALRWSEVRYPAAVVQEKEVFVRYGPAESNSKSHQLKEGASLRIEKRSGDWYLVRLVSGQTGWIPKNSVLVVTP